MAQATESEVEPRSWLARLLGRVRRGAREGAPCVLELYTRADCPLCDEMKHAIAAARLPAGVELREVDIASDPALERAFGLSIPVLAIDGRVAFKGRLTPRELAEKLARQRRGLRRGRAVQDARGERA